MKNILAIFMPALGLLLSCGKEAPDVDNVSQIVTFANAVDTSRVFPWVELLTQVHLEDTPINNEGYPPKDDYPSDHLTHTAAIGLIAQALSDMGYDVDTVALGSEPHVAYHLVAEHKGTTSPNEVVLVGAHFDAFYGGADDNSSAVAAVLEIARAARNFEFDRTIRFIAFDLEELGALGSTRYVEEGYTHDVVAAIVLDLIGYSSDKSGSQKPIKGVKLPDRGNYLLTIGNKNSTSYTQQITKIANTTGIARTMGILAPNDGGYFFSSIFTRSDHGLLWDRGFPAVFFSDGANTRNPHYHKASDLPQTLNRSFLNDNTRLIAASVALLAQIKP
jgi:hypothetical protein